MIFTSTGFKSVRKSAPDNFVMASYLNLCLNDTYSMAEVSIECAKLSMVETVKLLTKRNDSFLDIQYLNDAEKKKRAGQVRQTQMS